jgi:hypothetical protein
VALRRSAAAMLRSLWACRMPMARLRRLAMARGGVAGADLGGVLGQGGVAEVVQRLDAPVPRIQSARRAGWAWVVARLVTA